MRLKKYMLENMEDAMKLIRLAYTVSGDKELEEYCFFSMEYFNEVLKDFSPMQIASMSTDGWFVKQHDYFTFNLKNNNINIWTYSKNYAEDVIRDNIDFLTPKVSSHYREIFDIFDYNPLGI